MDLLTKVELAATIFCCIGVPLISFVKNEGMIAMAISQFCWMYFAWNSDRHFLLFQAFFLQVFNFVGIYFWIKSRKGEWLWKSFL